MTVRLRAPAGARPARDPRRRAAADAARLRRRAPLLRRPAAGRRDRPPAAALRLHRRGRARARVAARARALRPTRRRCRARSRFRSGRSSRSRRSPCSGRRPTPRRRTCCSTSCSRSPCSSSSSRARRSPPGCRARSAITAVALAAVFALVGLVEEATQRLIFYTPVGPDRERVLQLLPRHVALPRPEPLRPPARARDRDRADGDVVPQDRDRCSRRSSTVFLFAGLFFSYSQSSLVALFAVAVFISVVAGDRAVRLVAAVTAVVVLAGGGAFVADKVAGASTQRVTSDRSRRIDLTVKVIRAPPARRRRPRLAAEGEPGRLEERRPAEPLRLAHDAADRRSPSSASSASLLYAALLARRREGAPARRSGSTTRSGSRSPRCSPPCSCTRCSTAASSRIPSPGSCSGSPRASSSRGPSRRRRRRVSGSRIDRRAAFGVLGVLGALVALNVPALGSDPWPFRRLRSRATACSGPSSAPPTAAGTSASSAPRPSSPACSSPRSPSLGWRAQAWRPWVLVAACVGGDRAHRRARDAAPGRPARRLRAVVPRERLDLPDRARRRSSSATGTPRTGTTTRAPASSASTAATARVPPPAEHPQVALRTSPTSPAPP